MLSFSAVRPDADGGMGEKLSSCIAPLMKVLMAVSAISLFLMMLVTVVDVVGRSFFNVPLEGSMEWCELLMLMVALCLAFLALTVLITMVKDWQVARVQNLPVHAVLAFCFGLLLCAAPFILAGTRLGLSPGVLGAAIMFFLFVLILTGMLIGMAMMVAGLEGLLIFMPSLPIPSYKSTKMSRFRTLGTIVTC